MFNIVGRVIYLALLISFFSSKDIFASYTGSNFSTDTGISDGDFTYNKVVAFVSANRGTSAPYYTISDASSGICLNISNSWRQSFVSQTVECQQLTDFCAVGGLMASYCYGPSGLTSVASNATEVAHLFNKISVSYGITDYRLSDFCADLNLSVGSGGCDDGNFSLAGNVITKNRVFLPENIAIITWTTEQQQIVNDFCNSSSVMSSYCGAHAAYVLYNKMVSQYVDFQAINSSGDVKLSPYYAWCMANETNKNLCASYPVSVLTQGLGVLFSDFAASGSQVKAWLGQPTTCPEGQDLSVAITGQCAISSTKSTFVKDICDKNFTYKDGLITKLVPVVIPGGSTVEMVVEDIDKEKCVARTAMMKLAAFNDLCLTSVSQAQGCLTSLPSGGSGGGSGGSSESPDIAYICSNSSLMQSICSNYSDDAKKCSFIALQSYIDSNALDPDSLVSNNVLTQAGKDVCYSSEVMFSYCTAPGFDPNSLVSLVSLLKTTPLDSAVQCPVLSASDFCALSQSMQSACSKSGIVAADTNCALKKLKDFLSDATNKPVNFVNADTAYSTSGLNACKTSAVMRDFCYNAAQNGSFVDLISLSLAVKNRSLSSDAVCQIFTFNNFCAFNKMTDICSTVQTATFKPYSSDQKQCGYKLLWQSFVKMNNLNFYSSIASSENAGFASDGDLACKSSIVLGAYCNRLQSDKTTSELRDFVIKMNNSLEDSSVQCLNPQVAVDPSATTNVNSNTDVVEIVGRPPDLPDSTPGVKKLTKASTIYLDSERNGIAKAVCAALKFMNLIIIPIAAIGISALGFMAFQGKLTWSLFLTFAIGIGAFRSAGTVLELFFPGLGFRDGCNCAIAKKIRNTNGVDTVFATGLTVDCVKTN